MPISYDIDHSQRLVTTTLYGLLTDAEVFGYQEEVWSRSDVKGYNELVDMTSVTKIESVSAARMDDLARLASNVDPLASPSKLAIVATADLHFGLGRMYQVRREMNKKSTKEVRVFRNRREALDWLGSSSES